MSSSPGGSAAPIETSQRAPAPAEQALVSVVIPVYNNEAHIGVALDSVFAQDYPALEIIVVDDGSTDSTREVVARYGPRVRLLTQTNQGSGAARNLGIQHASGRYIAFLDGDDVWWPRKVAEQVRALQHHNGYRMVYSRFLRWIPDAQGRFADPAAVFARADPDCLAPADVVSGSPYAELLLDCIVWTSTVLVEKSALEEVGLFDQGLRKGQDLDLWLRLSRSVPMLGMETPTALYRIHLESITLSLKPVNYEYKILSRAVQRWGESGPDGRRPPPGAVQRRLARSALDHGGAHLKRGDPQIAVTSLGQAMRHSRPSARLALKWLLAWGKFVLARLRRRPG